MRAQWAGVDENICTKMCWKLVNDNSGEIINLLTIRSAIEPGSANLQVDPLKPLPAPVVDTNIDDILDDFISVADFEMPLSSVQGPVNSIPDSTKSRVWQETLQEVEHHEDIQQRHFHSSHPKFNKQVH